MPNGEIETLIANLSPEDLRVYKLDLRQRIETLEPGQRQNVISRLSGISQLQELTQEFQPKDELSWYEKPLAWAAEQPVLGPVMRAVGKVTAPIEEHFAKPIASSLWGLGVSLMPGEQSGEAQLREAQARGDWSPWHEGFKQAYESAETPWGVKGTLEMLPWLAIPAGRIARMGTAGLLGAGATAAGVTGLAAKAIIPKAVREAIAGAVRPVTAPIGQAIEKTAFKLAGIPQSAVTKLEERLALQETPVVQKLTKALQESKITRGEVEELMHAERQKRAAVLAKTYERYEGQEAFIRAKGALKGPLVEKVPGAPIERFTTTEVNELFNIIKKQNFQGKPYDLFAAQNAFNKVFAEAKLPTAGEIQILTEAFGIKLGKALLSKRPMSAKVWEKIVEGMNLPRSILASWDVSAPLRQAGPMFWGSPKQTIPALKPMFGALLSEKAAILVDEMIRGGRYATLRSRANLFHAPLSGAAPLAAREEAWIGASLGRFIPGVRPSERAYLTYLNKVRADKFNAVVANWEAAGEKVFSRAFQPKIKQLATFINVFTGRGSMPGGLKNIAPVLSGVFFSPRLQIARLQTPFMALSTPLVRKEWARSMVAFIGMNSGLAAMMKFSGLADVNLDPLSADFGKIKIGNTRIDMWAGFQQYARLVFMLTSQQRTTLGGRRIPQPTGETLARFGQSKMAPVPGLLMDIWRGQTFIGEEMSAEPAEVLQQARDRLVPMAIQDIMDAIEEHGLSGGFVAAPAMLGGGVQTYGGPTDLEKIYAKKAEELGIEPNQLTLAQKLRLEETDPEVQEEVESNERRRERAFTAEGISWRDWTQEGEAIEDSFRQEAVLAVKEFEATGDGYQFQERIRDAKMIRGGAYKIRESKTDKYQTILDYYATPLTPEQTAKMSPQDLARKEYYAAMFSDDMYDEFGRYRWDEADKRQSQLVAKYGSELTDYIDEVSAAKWPDKPSALVALEAAQKILQPYWDIADAIWAQHPPELRELSEQLDILERMNPGVKKQWRLQYPQLVWAEKQIETYRQQLRQADPSIDRAVRLFYRR